MSSQRPLSPHLQVYRPQITSLMSISHRLTGIILSSGILLLGALLTSLAMGATCYERFYDALQNGFGKAYLFVLCYSFYYHLCNGVRHLSWDMGYGFEMPQVRASGWVTLMTSLTLTLITWFII